ncbi:MAG TPA: outer membrane beta-barrel protein [Edaphocola sp.]|nr:outer membrane beta-barrel protein [Edaphocola sp.]
MKRLLISLLTLVSALTATAQIRDIGIFGSAGYNFFKQKSDDILLNFEFPSSVFKMGIFSSIKLDENGFLLVQPTLDWTKTSYIKEDIFLVGWQSYTQTYRNPLTYISLRAPIGLGSPDFKFFIGAGPYISYLLPGNQKITNENNPQENTTRRLLIGNNKTDDFKQTDIGITLGGNINLGPVLFGGFMDLGLKNISPKENMVVKNKFYYIVLGICLFREK